MSEDIDKRRRRFLGAAGVTIGATSAVAGAFSLLPARPCQRQDGPTHEYFNAARAGRG